MNYRSLNDLSRLTTAYASRVPEDVELVVGIPRSGMLAASIIALKLNIPLTDSYSFLRNDELKKGNTRTYKHDRLTRPQEARKILLVDDSIASGNSLRAVVDEVKQVYDGAIVTLVAFAERHNSEQVDVHFELVEQPRMFEWNIMHHPFLVQACMEIDGVICVAPTPAQRDDGPLYQDFLRNTRPLIIPSLEVGHLVTGRAEKYRSETEDWLKSHGVRYGQLHMLDTVPSEARRFSAEHRFKAERFSSARLARFFIESDAHQAMEIMSATGRPVYCVETNEMYTPGKLALLRSNAARTTELVRTKGLIKLKEAIRKRFTLSSVPKV
jgi:uncharacterized HAD superfamily protein/adenine/guanine phosphoribosyltransferase-like PRPP-binding protein